MGWLRGLFVWRCWSGFASGCLRVVRISSKCVSRSAGWRGRGFPTATSEVPEGDPNCQAPARVALLASLWPNPKSRARTFTGAGKSWLRGCPQGGVSTWDLCFSLPHTVHRPDALNLGDERLKRAKVRAMEKEHWGFDLFSRMMDVKKCRVRWY